MGSLKGGTEGADIETPKLRLEKRSLEFKKKTSLLEVWYLMSSVLLQKVYGH